MVCNVSMSIPAHLRVSLRANNMGHKKHQHFNIPKWNGESVLHFRHLRRNWQRYWLVAVFIRGLLPFESKQSQPLYEVLSSSRPKRFDDHSSNEYKMRSVSLWR